jgi:hypothetical protein
MREIRGNMFGYLGRMKFRLFLTTNGFIKNDGTAVMGRGNAAQAVRIFRDEYDMNLPELLGRSLKMKGNVVSRLTEQLYTFPVKHHWADRASRRLIKQSVERLKEIIKEDNDKDRIYVLPRPGCGNGNLKWLRDVKPILESLPDNVWVICDWDDPQWKEEHADKSHTKETKHHRSVVQRKTKSHYHSKRSRKSRSNDRKQSHSSRRSKQRRDSR